MTLVFSETIHKGLGVAGKKNPNENSTTFIEPPLRQRARRGRFLCAVMTL